MDTLKDITGNWLKEEEIFSLLKPRQPESNKGTYGHALLIAGSKGKMGAAVIAARAALRTGAGLLTVNIPEQERGIIQTALPEAMLAFRKAVEQELTPFSAIGIGPAIGTDDAATALLTQTLQQYKKPLLIDADAITILSQHKDLWTLVPENSVLTPHPKEFDRLFGASANDMERLQKALALSAQYHWVIVLKNHYTLVAVEGQSYFNSTGNAGLAKGGSGDMLSGMITALLAQNYEPATAAKIGVYLHGLAADIAVKEQSLESMLATDVIEKIGAAFTTIYQHDSIPY